MYCGCLGGCSWFRICFPRHKIHIVHSARSAFITRQFDGNQIQMLAAAASWYWVCLSPSLLSNQKHQWSEWTIQLWRRNYSIFPNGRSTIRHRIKIHSQRTSWTASVWCPSSSSQMDKGKSSINSTPTTWRLGPRSPEGRDWRCWPEHLPYFGTNSLLVEKRFCENGIHFGWSMDQLREYSQTTSSGNSECMSLI